MRVSGRFVAVGLAAFSCSLFGSAAAQTGERGAIALSALAVRSDSTSNIRQLAGCTVSMGSVMADQYLEDYPPERMFGEFSRILSERGYDVVGDPYDLFDDDDPETDYSIGGVLTHVEGTLCAPFLVRAGRQYPVSGDLSLTVQWQFYSSLERRVVARVETHGSAEDDERRINNFVFLADTAFAEAVEALIQTEEFQSAVSGGRRDPDSAPSAGGETVTIIGPETDAPVSLEDAVGSVVAVRVGRAHGSGALISSEGHIVTNAHVVGEASRVTIIWSDGLETVGEVLRVNERRDVALIKTNPRGRVPLAFDPEPPSVGQNVFAIGAPFETELQNSVASGIVSANRILDGFSFIQSDAFVNPGNSGGPLVDENGRIRALTVSGRREDGPTGINFFIPAADVIAFLSLDIQ